MTRPVADVLAELRAYVAAQTPYQRPQFVHDMAAVLAHIDAGRLVAAAVVAGDEDAADMARAWLAATEAPCPTE